MDMNHIVGVYWGPRAESKTDCSKRASRFLEKLATCDSRLSTWFKKQKNREQQMVPIPRDVSEIDLIWRSNHEDVGGAPIAELGFHLGAWFDSSSLSIACGASSAVTPNCVVISFGEKWQQSTVLLRGVLAAAVDSFEPEHGIAISSASLQSQRKDVIWNATGLVNYSRRSGFRVAGGDGAGSEKGAR